MKRDAIIFYDGECGLCQRSIRVLASLDKHHQLKFAPLNGKTFLQQGLKPSDLDTVIFFLDGVQFVKSEAIIEALLSLSKYYFIVRFFKLIPKFIRDFVYDLVAKNRHHVSCPLLIKDHRFLD